MYSSEAIQIQYASIYTFLMLVLVLFLLPYVFGSPPEFDHGVDLPTTRPLNIAHRGASGAYPENTLKVGSLAVSFYYLQNYTDLEVLDMIYHKSSI